MLVPPASSPAVQRAITTWNRILEHGDNALQMRQELMEGVREHGLMYGSRPISTFLRPRFIDVTTWQQARRVGARIHVGLSRMMKSLACDPATLELLGIRDRLADIVRDSGAVDENLYFVRLDGFLEAGVLRFVEFNADSPGGAAFVDIFADVYAKLPVFREFASAVPLWRRPSIPMMVAAVARAARGCGRQDPRVAVVDWAEVATVNEFHIIARELERNGFPTVVCDPREMEICGDRLTVRGLPVDILIKRVLVTDLATRHEDSAVLCEALRRRLVVSLNPPACQAVTPKSLFALFWEGRFDGVLGERARAVWERHLPLTMRVREAKVRYKGDQIDVVSYVAANRERLVLKPADGWGADGVLLGWKATESQWREAVQKALLAGDHVAQERIAIPLEDFPDADEGALRYRTMRTEVSPYTFYPGTVCECLARLSTNDLMNVKTGGGVVTTYVVAD